MDPIDWPDLSKAMTNALISSCDVDGFRVDTPMLLGENRQGKHWKRHGSVEDY